jgi:hypothetical protein
VIGAAGRLALVGLLVGLCSCATASRYGRSRTMDLLDAVPISVGWGFGLSASAKATPLLHLGLGVTPVIEQRFGYEDRSFHGHWHEYQTAFPWTFWLTDFSLAPPRPPGANEGRLFGDGVPIMYRWQIDRDAPSGEGHHRSKWEPQPRQWGRHPPIGRESGGALLIPEYRRALDWRDLRTERDDDEQLYTAGAHLATLWEVSRDGRDLPQAWDLFEADVFVVFVGLRIGVRPVEFVDLVVGLVGLDPLGDDLRDGKSTLARVEADG